jgi:hypothetical protein
MVNNLVAACPTHRVWNTEIRGKFHGAEPARR